MSDVYVGNNIVGNFRPKEKPQYNNIEDYHIDKYSGSLYLKNKEENIILEPLDENANLVVNNFSNEIGEDNTSIYRLEHIKNTIVVILYVYSKTLLLLEPSQQLNIHLRRETEKRICRDGDNGIRLDKQDDIVPYFTNMFINNKSIFVHFNNKTSNDFQIYGNKYRASVKMERPGVYFIDKIFKTYNKFFSESLTQIYGNIKFVLWKDSIELSGNPKLNTQDIKTNDIFKAWEQYMDFEDILYQEELKSVGTIKYNKININEYELEFELENNIEEQDLEKLLNLEFEFISEYVNRDENDEDNIRVLPNTIEQLLVLKETKNSGIVYLGKCKQIKDKKLIFDIPDRNFFEEMKNYSGYLYKSDHSLNIERTRRKRVLKIIDSRKNESANFIMKLSEEKVQDDTIGTDNKPINNKVLKKMFGNKNIKLKENYREAMYIALNTPELALIQGPPGSGKTTLIKGLITRINQMNKNYRILVSSEQHEALYNVVNKLSQNKFIPPFVSSKKFAVKEDDDNERFEKNVISFQENFISLCKDLLNTNNSKNNKSIYLTEIIYILQNIRNNNYAKNYISTVIDELKSNLIKIEFFSKLNDEFSKLEILLKSSDNNLNERDIDFVTKTIIRKINSQRTEILVFIEDDGMFQLEDLQRLLKDNGYTTLLLDENLLENFRSANKEQNDKKYKLINPIFLQYQNYVENLKQQFISQNNNEFDVIVEDSNSMKDIIEDISKKISILSNNIHKDFYEIIEELMFKLNDIDSSYEIIKKYTTVVGSTCAQADKTIDLVDLQNEKFDYVIIDEAARANPLDIMIPMMQGIKVILIGDHKQLPHYIESNYVKKFKQEKEKYSKFDEKLLTKSLFQIIYENLEKAYKEGRIKYKRTIRINEQHRMHPIIGNFISDTFYTDNENDTNNKLINAEETKYNTNDYNVFDSKNIVWINVPIFNGCENKVNTSYNREIEVDKIMLVLKEIVNKNKDKELKVGIITFYEQQRILIENKLKESFPANILGQDKIECGTVDSFQGKEFDIVIISCVRCNNYSSPGKSLGFIHFSPSRINVSLSRARKLLIVIGDADTYKKNEYFEKFISYVKEKGLYAD